MTRDGEIDTDVFRPVWWIGWNWIYVCLGVPVVGIGLGYRLGDAPGFTVATLAVAGGPVFAISGLLYVHAKKRDVVHAGTAIAERESEAIARLDGPTETHSVMTATGESLPLLPRPTVRVVTMLVGRDRLVHTTAEIHLPTVTCRVGDDADGFHYDRVEGVEYISDESTEGGTLRVNLVDGQNRSWDTMTDADGARQSVQHHLQAHDSW